MSGRHPRSRPPASAPRPLFALLALGVLLVTFSAGLALLLTRGADDLGLVGVLSTDEELAARIVRHMLVVRRPDPNHFFAYGALAHELTALALVPAALIGTVSDTTVIAVARGTSLAGGVATVALTGVLAWRLFGAPAGVAAAALLAATPELAVWSVTAHPDTVQLALLTAALLVAVDLPCAPTRRRLAVCGVLAGLAFGTKYLGALALPLLLVAAIAGRRRAGAPPLTVRTVAADAAVLGAAFATAFAITNPYALAEPLRALGQVREEAARARAGHVFAGAGRLGWLGAFASPALGGPALPALAGPAAVFYLGRRRSPAPAWSPCGCSGTRSTCSRRSAMTRLDTPCRSCRPARHWRAARSRPARGGWQGCGRGAGRPRRGGDGDGSRRAVGRDRRAHGCAARRGPGAVRRSAGSGGPMVGGRGRARRRDPARRLRLSATGAGGRPGHVRPDRDARGRGAAGLHRGQRADPRSLPLGGRRGTIRGWPGGVLGANGRVCDAGGRPPRRLSPVA
ncbi:MAG: glycosyltransferase family 39 protein [Dehalococcoidia bacterium]